MAHYIKNAHRIWKDDLTNAACAIGHSQSRLDKMTDEEAATLAAALVRS
jgi:hypothetical protein